MALLTADRVKETSTTTGTGTYSLGGAATGFRTFVAGIGTGNQCHYCVEDGTDWEVGIGTVTTGSPSTLSRDTILASSNAGAAVNWSAGTRNLFLTAPASVFPQAAVKVTRATAQTITTSTLIAVQFTAEVEDSAGVCDLGAANTKILTAPVASWWIVSVQATWDPAGAIFVRAFLTRFNSSNVAQESWGMGAASIAAVGGYNIYNTLCTSNLFRCDAGDYFTLRVEHTRGSNLDLLSASATAARQR